MSFSRFMRRSLDKDPMVVLATVLGLTGVAFALCGPPIRRALGYETYVPSKDGRIDLIMDERSAKHTHAYRVGESHPFISSKVAYYWVTMNKTRIMKSRNVYALGVQVGYQVLP